MGQSDGWRLGRQETAARVKEHEMELFSLQARVKSLEDNQRLFNELLGKYDAHIAAITKNQQGLHDVVKTMAPQILGILAWISSQTEGESLQEFIDGSTVEVNLDAKPTQAPDGDPKG